MAELKIIPGTIVGTYTGLVQQAFTLDYSAIEPDTAELEKNCRRLVACWNACEGIDTAFLEGKKFTDCSTTHAAIAQRDELLAALEQIAASSSDSTVRGLQQLASAAIFAAQPTAGPTIAELQEAGHVPKAEPTTIEDLAELSKSHQVPPGIASRLLASRANKKLAEQRDWLLVDLGVAAYTLRRYEKLHRAKNTDESTAKAEVNAELATRFEATIAKVQGGAA